MSVYLREAVTLIALTMLSLNLFTFAATTSQFPSDQAKARRSNNLVADVRPLVPYIEKRGNQQFVNFDLLIEDVGQESFDLVAIKLWVYDRSGKLEIERQLNENGHPPALDIVGKRRFAPGEVVDLFQPFFSFDGNVDLTGMRLELMFMRQGRTALPVPFTADETVFVEVRPQVYNPRAFCLPLRGLVLVQDGHDFYSHHRRFDLASRFRTNPATAVASNLYAYDFVRTNGSGALFQSDPNRKENWLSYGAPIFAPSDGIVVDVANDLPENSFSLTGEAQRPPESDTRDPNGFGNHVTVKHADGRVSWLLHMIPGSVRVKTGEHVYAGQQLGRIGFSGDSLFPHLHYTVTNSSNYPSQSVPSYFRDFTRILGNKRIPIPSSSLSEINTGDLVEGLDRACH